MRGCRRSFRVCPQPSDDESAGDTGDGSEPVDELLVAPATVVQPPEDMGTRAVEHLLERLNAGAPATNLTLPCRPVSGQPVKNRELHHLTLLVLPSLTVPFMIRAVLAVLSSTDFKTREESAASLGARFWQRFFQIVIPNCRSGILTGSLMVATLSIGEFNLTSMWRSTCARTVLRASSSSLRCASSISGGRARASSPT